MADRILFETHLHTPLCKHARGEPEEYAAVAEARGLAGMIVTCHCPLPEGHSSHVRMAPEQFDSYLALVERARRAWAGRVEIRLGLESDYYPGVEAWLEELHGRAAFDFVLGSIHPQIPEYRAAYYRGGPLEYQINYFDHLACAAESGLYDSLAHPDLVKNEAPDAWDFDRIAPHILRALDRIAATGVAMELNTSGRLKAVPEFNPGPRILHEIARRGIPITMGADAHRPERVADCFEDALDLLAASGFTHVGTYRERKRQEIAIPLARTSLRTPA
jgi:histidinol-phosphatase (PHP family)